MAGRVRELERDLVSCREMLGYQTQRADKAVAAVGNSLSSQQYAFVHQEVNEVISLVFVMLDDGRVEDAKNELAHFGLRLDGLLSTGSKGEEDA